MAFPCLTYGGYQPLTSPGMILQVGVKSLVSTHHPSTQFPQKTNPEVSTVWASFDNPTVTEKSPASPFWKKTTTQNTGISGGQFAREGSLTYYAGSYQGSHHPYHLSPQIRQESLFTKNSEKKKASSVFWLFFFIHMHPWFRWVPSPDEAQHSIITAAAKYGEFSDATFLGLGS